MKQQVFSAFLLSGAGLTDRHHPSVPRSQLLERGDEIEISSLGAEIISFNKLNFQSFIILRCNLKSSPRRCRLDSVEMLELELEQETRCAVHLNHDLMTTIISTRASWFIAAEERGRPKPFSRP